MWDLTVGTDSDEPERCTAWGCAGLWDKTISRAIPLCLMHFAQAHAQYANSVTESVRRNAAVDSSPQRKDLQLLKVAYRREGGPVVYYVSMPPHIKIGTTTNFRRRMREFYTQRDDVLAVEPGGRPLEASRHQQFAAFRIKGTELFEKNSVLDELIAELAARKPDPWLAADNIHNPPSPIEKVSREVYEGREKLGLVPDNAYVVGGWYAND